MFVKKWLIINLLPGSYSVLEFGTGLFSLRALREQWEENWICPAGMAGAIQSISQSWRSP